MLKKIYQALLAADGESAKLLQMIESYANRRADILDVGCGYGRNLNLLKSSGYANVTGVEKNHEIVKFNKECGLPCVSVEEFDQATEKFDIILMSHVIEHFPPFELKEFIDGYLDKLKQGGYLVIATPLMSDYFYDDFDHVKPYHPGGILAVFGAGKEQVQYYSRNKLVLKDVWFRKSPYRICFAKGRFLKGASRTVVQLYSLIGALIFLLSNRFFGKKDGWVAIFEKVTTV